ncbi:hypothetical protein [Agrobacterium sp. Azo12]|uniref:hypothetical protein n=1 Tax=Agrobacterium sp. Azo12 TaxID=3031129 RepID=UPI0023D83EDB|nr:hypothetical protein [Agrobacterium sp. Azo12]MDO5895646.1 hypothetical protein [Agrobacterium sp. Azo12]
MRKFITTLVLSVASLALMSTTPAFAQTKATQAKTAKANAWDGTWSGTSSGGGRKTTVKISNGKVTFWTNNGFPRPKVTGSVSGNSVKLDDNNGWKGTMTMQGEGKAKISASGIGNNGKPAQNSALLRKH